MKKNLDFSSMSAVEAGYRRRQRKSTVITLVLAVLVLMLAAFMMLYGNTIYTPRQVWDALNEVEGSAVFTVKTLRLPRMLTAILAGFAFGMAGNTFQQLLGNPLAMGESHAVTLGVKSKMVRLALILLSLLLVAFATSVTGPIASVAFLAGPIAARLCGGGRTNMLASALVGSVLVLASDLIGQFALPSRYPVGVVTGILGAPYLIFLLLRMNKKSETV